MSNPTLFGVTQRRMVLTLALLRYGVYITKVRLRGTKLGQPSKVEVTAMNYSHEYKCLPTSSPLLLDSFPGNRIGGLAQIYLPPL